MGKICYYINKVLWLCGYDSWYKYRNYRYSKALDNIIYDCIWHICNRNAVIHITKHEIIVNSEYIQFRFNNNPIYGWLSSGMVSLSRWSELSPSASASFDFYWTLKQFGKDPKIEYQMIEELNLDFKI